MSNEKREEQMMDSAKSAELNSRTIDLSKKRVFMSAYIQGWRAADSHPQWIPVEEELPPPHYEGANSTDFVLVYDGYDLEFGYYDFEQKNWHGEDYKEMMFDVTHWMPLPQPPRKED